jgi:hypothetical protein
MLSQTEVISFPLCHLSLYKCEPNKLEIYLLQISQWLVFCDSSIRWRKGSALNYPTTTPVSERLSSIAHL